MRVEGQGTEAGGNGQDEQDLDTTPYCFCQQPAHGDMLGCDSGRCRYEWFHFSCLGITTPPPVDKWYCNDCGKG
ncbi:Phd domain in Ing1-like protein [Mycena amicta]|nr:Phd domain in Ing1-like protein [Mycena amicta]